MAQTHTSLLINALRGHFVRNPQAQNMQELLLACGENIQPGIRKMVEAGELVMFRPNADGPLYYQLTEKLRPYKPVV